MLTASEIDPRIGTVLDGKLKLTRVLGRGGMGVVYNARQLSMDRDVAVKVLHPQAVADQESINRFLHEAKVASKLRHPNLITVFDFGQSEDGLLYLVMELLSGMELADVLQDKVRLPATRVVPIAVQICDAVQHAHDKGLIHRDLKPENVFLLGGGASRRGDFVKVLDFGIARAVQTEGEERLTRTGMLCGTPAYMSPEQILGDPVDGRTDVYAIGIMLFELLTGRLPYHADTPMRLMMAHLDAPVPALTEADTGVPKALFAVVQQAMAKRPADRPATAVVLADALSAALDGKMPARPAMATATARYAPAAPRPLAATVAGAPMPLGRIDRDPEEATVTGRSRRRRMRGGLGGAAAALIAVVAILAAGDDEPARPSDVVALVASPMPRSPGPRLAPEVPPQVTAIQPDTAKPEVIAPPLEADTTPSVLEPTPVPVQVSTTPPGATVTRNGTRLGITPLAIPRPPAGETWTLFIEKPAFLAIHQAVDGTAGPLDLVLTPVPPVRRRPPRAARPARPPPPAKPLAPKPPPPPPAARSGAGIID